VELLIQANANAQVAIVFAKKMAEHNKDADIIIRKAKRKGKYPIEKIIVLITWPLTFVDQWKQIRLVWLGFLKDSLETCPFALLPKEIVQMIVYNIYIV
jgi:hypothetical protein